SPNLDLRQEIRLAVSEAMQQMVSSGALRAASGTATTSPAARPVTGASFAEDGEGEGVDFDEDALLGNLLDDAAIAA
ncbi:MAG: hypothetical protein MUF49_19985, partial [Oculatellaceae cyanobacterium Prado106]|nr:hypothetical protein [Oculatellaceae cyanobacterium Prado106]